MVVPSNYNYFRDYDPQVGRYIESDPIGLIGGSWSTYAYVGSNPISNFDSNGLEAVAAMSRLGWGLPSPPPNSSGCGCSPRLPDYATLQLDLYVFSMSATYTKYGDVFWGKGVSRPYPNPVGGGVSISNGWLLNCNPTRADLNNFLIDWSGGAGGYYLFGGSYSINASGSAINLGIGVGGASVNPAMVNSYQGRLGDF